MSYEINLPDPREFVDESEIETLEKVNEVVLSTYYLGHVNEFRARAFLKLCSVDAMKPGLGWAIFADNDQGSSLISGSPREILLIMSTYEPEETGKIVQPLIRVVTNETIPSENGLEVMSQDVIIDSNSDALYFASSALVHDGSVRTDTVASIFTIVESKLILNRSNLGSMVMQALSEPGLATPIRPFGDLNNFEDKLYALDRATEFLAEVQALEPIFKLSTQQS